MQYNQKTQKYFDIVFSEMKSMLNLDDPKNKKEIGEAVMNKIFGGNNTTKAKSREFTKKEIFLANKIFKPLSEIMLSLEAIENISIYIRYRPSKHQRVSELRYLQYHIENYLHELYILEQRLESYLTMLYRAYKKSNRKTKIDDIVSIVRSYVREVFAGYISIRGDHVHQSRYMDGDLSRLQTLSLFSNTKDMLGSITKLFFEIDYKDIRKKWRKKIEVGIKNIHELLDVYFVNLTNIISINDKIIYPF